MEVYQPDREKQVLQHVRAIASEGPLGPDAIARLFERIIDEARRLERRVVHGETDESRPGRPARRNREQHVMVVVMQEGATDTRSSRW